MEKKSEIIHIRTPFWSAGRKYGWEGKPTGLGINLKYLRGSGDLLVKVSNGIQIWKISKQEAIDFVDKYKSLFEVKGSRLGVIAWSAFSPIKLTNQKTLF